MFLAVLLVLVLTGHGSVLGLGGSDVSIAVGRAGGVVGAAALVAWG